MCLLTILRRWRYLHILILLLFILNNGKVYAQAAKQNPVATIEIKGVIYDDTRQPLMGATVKEEGTNNIVLSQKDGSYSIKIKSVANPKLVFSFIGMKTQTFEIKAQRKIDVVLEMNANIMNEVIITGYGDLKKDEYTGSANVIKSESLADRPAGSFENLLSGLSPGISVASSGQPGDIAEVRLRGVGSIGSSSQPLYVIDGVVFDQDNMSGHSNAASSPMAAINPADIASITILKDAASASLYGSQGANGVIVITTKKGTASDRLRFNISAQAGISNIFHAVKPDLVSADEYKELWVEGEMHSLIKAQSADFISDLNSLYADKSGYKLNGLSFLQYQKKAQQEFNAYYALRRPDGTYHNYDFFGADYDKLPNNDWYDAVTKTARFQQYDFSLNGGSSNLKYYLSLGYLDQEGVIINSGLKRYSLNFNLNADDRSKLINWGVKMTLSATEQSGPLTSGNNYVMPHYSGLLLPAVVPITLEDGSYNFAFPNNLVNGSHNPVASANLNIRSRPQFTMLASGWLRLNLSKWLDFTSDLSQYYITGNRSDYFDKDFGSGFGSNGSLTEYSSMRLKLTNRNHLKFNYTINNRHRFNALAGFEVVNFKQTWNSTTAVNFVSDDKPVLSTGAEISSWAGSGYDYGMLSLISKVDYSYRYRYFLSSSFRRDQSSRFGPNYRTGDFWSVSGAYRISNENWAWVKSLKKIFNDIKFKASYGYNGALPSTYYNWQTLFTGTPIFNGSKAIYQTFRTTEDLTWEKNRIVNVGLDLGLLKNRFNVSMEYYRRQSSDLLQDLPVSNTSGYSTILINTDAGIINQGFEMDVMGKIIDKQVKWTTNFNLATLSSKYTGLQMDILSGNKIRRNGQSVDAWYTANYGGINSFTGEILYRSKDANGNEILSGGSGGNRIIGKALPSVTGGFSNSVSYKGWDLSALVTYGLGHTVFNSRASSRTDIDGSDKNYNISRDQLDRWTPDNVLSNNRIRIHERRSGGGTRFMYDGDYLKFKNVRLNYSFPPSTFRKWGISNLGIFAQAENLGVITAAKGYDPDLQMDGNISIAKFPTSTTFTTGLRLNL